MSIKDIAEMEAAKLIAISAYRAFRYAMHNTGPHGQEMPTWDGLPEEAQDGWLRAVFVVRVESEEADHVPWLAIARSAYRVYARAVGHGAGEWDGLELKQRTAWSAAARHILSLFEADDLTEETLEALEASWSSWSDRKNAERTVETTGSVQG